MRRLLRDAFRGLTEDDNNRRAPAQASQAGPFHGGPIPPPQGSQGQGMWPPPPGMCPPPALGTATSHHLPPSGTSVYGSPPPAHGIGVPQPLTVPYQPRPSLAGFANPQHHHHGQMAGIPAPAGMEYWYSQVAMPPRGQQPAMISPPAVLPQSSVAPQQTMTRGPLPNIPTAGTGNTSSSQGAHSSVLTLPVRPAAPETPGQLHCRWCQKCKRGLAYCTLSFICTTCRAWLCPGCSEVHRRTHNKEYVRAELRQWGAAPPPSFSNAEAICVVCPGSKEVRARMQCKYCSYALCLSCCSNSVALTMFLGPAHSLRHMSLGKKAVDIELLVVYPESWFVTEKRRSQAYHCQERPTAIMHCYRCHLLIEIGQHVQWCRGCFSDWGINQWLCGTCFEEELHRGQQQKLEQQPGLTPENQQEAPKEKHKHDFVKVLIVDASNEPDTRKEAMYCRTCELWLATEKDRNTHFHAHVNTNTDIFKRQAYLEWRISPRMLKDRLLLHKKCSREDIFQTSAGQPGLVPK